MLLGLATAVHAQGLHAPGAEVPDGIVVQVPPAGLASLQDLIAPLVPADPVVIDDVDESGFCYEYHFHDGWVGIALDGITVTGEAPDTLDFEVDVTVWVNDPASEFELSHDSCVTSAETCYGTILPFPATVTAPVSIGVSAAGDAVWTVAIDPISFSHGLTADDIVLDNACSVQDIESVLDFFGLSLYELVIDYAEDYLVDELEAQAATIEADIEAALGEIRYADTIDLQGVPLTVQVLPSAFRVTKDGMVEVEVGTAFSAPADPCVAAYDPGGSLATPGDPGTASDLLPNTQAAVQISDDAVDQALYAVWRGGLLCQDVAGGELGGFAIDTTLLSLLGGEPYAAAFPETRPIALTTRPRSVPAVAWDGLHDVTVEVTDLQVDVTTEVDGRQARVLGATVAADVGLDAVFDPATGEVAFALDIGGDALDIVATSVGMVPVSDEELSAQVDGVLGTLLGTLVSSLVGETLTFPLPSVEGIGLTDVDVHASDDGTWGVAEAEAGPVTYGAEGCASCSSKASTSSCAVGPRGIAPVALALAIVGMRRRRSK